MKGENLSPRKMNDEVYRVDPRPIIRSSSPSSGDETNRRTSVERECMSPKTANKDRANGLGKYWPYLMNVNLCCIK